MKLWQLVLLFKVVYWAEKKTEILLLDVTPLNLGIETLGGVMTTLIPANTTIPTKKEQTFSTAADNQTEVEIKVLQGDRPMAADNKLLGRFNLIGIPPAPKGVPQIEVAFDIDANGIVNVTARDKATGKEHRIQIKSDGGLSKAEIERMKREAEANAEADKGRRDSTEAKNSAESTIWEIEKNLDTYKDQLTDNDRSGIQERIAATRKAIDANQSDQIKSAAKELQDYTSKLFAEAYQKKAQQNQGSSSSSQGGNSGSQGGQQQGGTSGSQGGQQQGGSSGEFKDV